MATKIQTLEELLNKHESNLTQQESKAVSLINRAANQALLDIEKGLKKKYPDMQSGVTSISTAIRAQLLVNQIVPKFGLVNTAGEEVTKTVNELISNSVANGALTAKQAAELIQDEKYSQFTRINDQAILAIAERTAGNLKNYSEGFKDNAVAILEQGLIQGWGLRRVARELENLGEATKSRMEMVARTETLMASNQAAATMMKSVNIEYFQWFATAGDKRTCQYCMWRNMNVYRLDQVAIPPSHPRCRCMPAPWSPEYMKSNPEDAKWVEQYRQTGLNELANSGKQPNQGVTPFEKMGGLKEAPKPIWKPGDSLDKFQGKPKVTKANTTAKPPKQTKAKGNPKKSSKGNPEATATPGEDVKPPITPPSPQEALSKPQEKLVFPESLDGLKVVDRLGGSTGALLVEDPVTGQRFVQKSGSSPGHIREEMMADLIYQAGGAKVPRFKEYTDSQGNPVKLAEFIQGENLEDYLRGKPAGDRDVILKQLGQNFALDAILGNWDVIGMSADNVLVDKDGILWRIDNGGSLRYRAQGAAKGDDWNNYPTELFSLRDPNRGTSPYFKDVNISDIVDQVNNLVINGGELLKPVKDQDLRDTLLARLLEAKELVDTADTLLSDKWKPEYTEEFVKHTLGLRKYGLVDGLPAEVKPADYSGDDTTLVDKDGTAWDNFRDIDNHVQKVADYMAENGLKYGVVADWLAAQAMSSWSQNSQAFKYFMASQRDVDIDEFYWKDGSKSAEVALNSVRKFYGSFDESMAAYHAYNYLTLKHTKFPNTNPDGTITVIRTLSEGVIKRYGLNPGDIKVVPEGAAESTSMFKPVEIFGDQLSIRRVPFHRVFANYVNSRNPSDITGALAGDNENEIVAMLDGLPMLYAGSAKDYDFDFQSNTEKLLGVDLGKIKAENVETIRLAKGKTSTPDSDPDSIIKSKIYSVDPDYDPDLQPSGESLDDIDWEVLNLFN